MREPESSETFSQGIDFAALPVVSSMSPITLGEMDAVRLMNRIDTKFLTDEQTLLRILDDAAAEGYRICSIEGERVTEYNSLYYDTDELFMYTAHHNGRKTRQKVRCRTYAISGATFLEIKRKNNHGRTGKKRIEIPSDCFEDFGRNPEAAAFLASKSWFTADQLKPSCTTRFRRITLVNPGMNERVTMDTALSFHNYVTGLDGNLGNAVIIELKQDGHQASQMKRILMKHRVMPYRISKYVIGIVLTDRNAKDNNFKEKIRYIEKTINHKITDRYEKNS